MKTMAQYWLQRMALNGRKCKSLTSPQAVVQVTIFWSNVLALRVTCVETYKRLAFIYWQAYTQARNQLATPGGAKSFLRGDKFFTLCPIDLNYFQNIFPGGGYFSGVFAPTAPHGYGPAYTEHIQKCTITEASLLLRTREK